MKVLLATTEDFVKRDKTLISADAAAGSSIVVSVENVEGLAVNDYVIVGIPGGEQAELTQISAVTNETITLALLKLAHKIGEPIQKLRYNKRKFYGCLTATGSFSELTGSGSPVLIEVGGQNGALLEYIGGEGYLYFKSTYFNSTTSEESNVADAVAVLADESSRYCSIYAIKKQAGLIDNPYISDGDIEGYRKNAENEVNSYLYQRYVLPLVNSAAAAEVPFILENVTKLLAAGYMDYREYGKDGEGVKWLGEARGILKALQKGTQRLIDTLGQEFGQKTLTQGVTSYPDQVDNTDDDGPQQKFSMNQTF